MSVQAGNELRVSGTRFAHMISNLVYHTEIICLYSISFLLIGTYEKHRRWSSCQKAADVGLRIVQV